MGALAAPAAGVAADGGGAVAAGAAVTDHIASLKLLIGAIRNKCFV